jgi:uncharacterized protein
MTITKVLPPKLKANNLRWLPFKFDRLHPDQVIISNSVGEWMMLNDQEFDQLANRDFSSEHLVRQLLAKHFIYRPNETTSQRLLPLKLATRNRQLVHGTGLHIFVVTLRCDHACEYCQVSRQNSKSTEFDMSEENAVKALEIAFSSPNPAIKIEFQGGESLLNFELIKFIVLRAKEFNKTHNKNLAFVTATNLAMLEDQMIDFAGEHDIYFSTSLDGPQVLHNQNRARPGKNSWELTIDGINRIREKLGNDRVSALMTTTAASLNYPEQIIDAYIEHGFDEVFLRYLSPYGHAIKTGSHAKYDNQRWMRFYFEGLDYIIELNKSGIDLTEAMASTYLKKMLTNEPTTFVDMSTPSGAGLGALVYNYDGDVYSSDEGRMLKEMGDQTFRLGSVATHSYQELMLSDVMLDATEHSFAPSAPMCSDCSLEPYCGSDATIHHTLQGDFVGFKPDSPFCERTMTIVPYLMKKYNEDEFCRDLFTRWANR